MSVLNLLYSFGFWVLLPLVTFAAWRWGSDPCQRPSPEQWAATAYSVAAAITLLRWAFQGAEYRNLSLLAWCIDLCLFGTLSAIALTADRWWPTLAAALIGLSALAHGAKLLLPELIPTGYHLLNQLSSYPSLLVLAIGTWRQHRRMARQN